MIKKDLKELQKFMRGNGIDGWLVADFSGRNPIFQKIMGESPTSDLLTRRAFLFIPRRGHKKLLISRADYGLFKNLRDIRVIIYSSHKDLKSQLKKLLINKKVVAMEYYPEGSLPYISIVDAGTVELIKTTGVNIVSSADLIGIINKWTKRELALHIKASRKVIKIKDESFKLISEKIKRNQKITDYQVQQFIIKRFNQLNLETVLAPIVAIDKNSSDPHYMPSVQKRTLIKEGSWILMDIWAKIKVKNGIFADITWVGYVGKDVPKKYKEVFDVVLAARDKSLQFLEKKIKKGEKVLGWQVDKIARDTISKVGLSKYFVHSLGHSLGGNVHADAVSFKSLSSKDERQVLPGYVYTIEPGVYLKDFGVRSEINVFVEKDSVKITTPMQKKILLL